MQEACIWSGTSHPNADTLCPLGSGFPMKGHKLWACFAEDSSILSSCGLAVAPIPHLQQRHLGVVAPAPRWSLLSLTNGRLLPSRKPGVFKEGNRHTVNPNDAKKGHGMEGTHRDSSPVSGPCKPIDIFVLGLHTWRPQSPHPQHRPLVLRSTGQALKS